MGIVQYKVGKSWEQKLLDYYHKKGYWSYKFPTEFNGTVCDIIICRSGSCMFIEAKHIKSDKLYYKSSGIYKKRDELDNFVKTSNNNIYIMIKSDKLGVYWTTWLKAKPIFEEKGHLNLEVDCYCANRTHMIYHDDLKASKIISPNRLKELYELYESSIKLEMEDNENNSK